MFKKLFLAFCLLSSVIFYATSSMAQYEVKDSYYFMKDDGIFSPEEKDEEAMYVYETCTKNTYKSTYLDCQCIAGAFRRERDKEELSPQDHILDNLYNSDNVQCVNSPQIAASTYEFCTSYATSFRRREKNNDTFCECVANNVAKRFSKQPIMNTRFIERIRGQALQSCG